MRRSLLLLAVLAATGCAPEEESAAPLPPARAAEPQTAELRWRETYPETGPQLRFHVDRLEVREEGWSVAIAVENAAGVPFELGARPLELRLGVLLFATGDLAELEEASAAGGLPSLRAATTIVPPPPARLEPGATWRATLSAPGSLADGTFLRVSFGTFVAAESPPKGMVPEVVWITDKSYGL